jgi:hypothetical protein
MKAAFVTVGIVICAVLGGLSLLHGCSHPSAPSTSSADDQQDVISTCQDSVKKMLKDPDSARFDDWTAWDVAPVVGVAHYVDEKDFSAKGMVNAKNGFGGYTGDEPYSCDAAVTSGTVHATARSES